MSLLPIRCFTCGKVIANNLIPYLELLKTHNQKNALDKLKYRRFCCRRMFLSYPDQLEEVLLLYPPITGERDPVITPKIASN